MKTKAILDTSFWINIFEMGKHKWLIKLFDVRVTPVVKSEILEGLKWGAADAIIFQQLLNNNRIKSEDVPKSDLYGKIIHNIHVGSGELEVFITSEKTNLIALIDDARVGWLLDKYGIKYLHSIHIPITLMQTKKITKIEAKKEINRIEQCFSRDILEEIKGLIR